MLQHLNIESVASTDGGPTLRVVFAWSNDRWAHEIHLVRASETIVIARSMEGDASHDWPPSPPIQELMEHEVEKRPVLLGVGMAGKNHWSLSAELEAGQSVRFDVACRVTEPTPGWLGTTYKIEDHVSVESTSDCEMRLESDGEIIEFATSDQNATMAFSAQERIITLSPPNSSDSPRWRYNVDRV